VSPFIVNENVNRDRPLKPAQLDRPEHIRRKVSGISNRLTEASTLSHSATANQTERCPRRFPLHSHSPPPLLKEKMSNPPRKPTIAIAGLAIETSTFHTGRTHAQDFHPRTGTAEITAYHAQVLGPDTALHTAANWVGALTGHALPGGPVDAKAYQELETDLLDRLRAIVDAHAASNDGAALDGLWFDIHGAMVVAGMRDAEAVLLSKIRGVIGRECVVSASMDLHGNVSRELAHMCDALTCYRTAPHVDVVETRTRACENLLAILRRRDEAAGQQHRGFRPFKAWVPVPILLPGEQTSTRDEPARTIYAAVPGVVEEAAAEGSVLDAAIWVGYAWADEPRDRGSVVVTGWDREAVGRGAEKLARLFWENREGFHFVAPTGSLAECLDTGLERIRDESKRPFFISDSGDNPTAGASGFNTWGLARVLEREEFKDIGGPQVIYASVPSAQPGIRDAVVGTTVTLTVGTGEKGGLDGPLTMTGRVHSVKRGDKDAKTEVVLQVGSVFAILTEKRKPYHKEKDFTDLDLEPRKADLVIVKIGYLEPELYDMANDWMLGLTPGGVDQDLIRLGHQEIRRPMFPFDKTFDKEPDLSARFIALSDEPLEGPDE
jgi:microcystin degradation protein MlrC